MSDVKDILGLNNAAIAAALPSKSKKEVKANPHLKGLAREVRNLMDEHNGPAIVHQQQQQYKAKRSRKVSWKRERIRSSARRSLIGKSVDDLEIFHWVKIHNMPDYRFAKANKALRMLQYTDLEYEQHLKDPSWSRAETDRLFDLCRRFDLRFLIIHDRFNPLLQDLTVPRIDPNLHEGFKFAIPHSSSLSKINENENGESRVLPPLEKVPPDPTEKAQPKKAASSPKVVEGPKNDSQRLNGQLLNEMSPQEKHTSSSDKPPDSGQKSVAEPQTASTLATETNSVPKEDPNAKVEALQNINGYNTDNKHLTVGYRSVEELKSRYYCCQKLLLKARCVAKGGRGEDVLKNALFEHEYDGEHERIRREQTELLLKRTPQMEKEIHDTIAESRKLDQKIRKVRKQLTVIKKNPKAALSAIKRNQSKSGSGSHKKGASSAIVRHSFSIRSLPAETPKANVPKECVCSNLFARESGVYATSYMPLMAPQLPGRTYKQLESELFELGIKYSSPRPFKAPSAKVCRMYDNLRCEIVTLINFNRYVAEREKERNRLRSSLRAQNKNLAAVPNEHTQMSQSVFAPSTSSNRKSSKKRSRPKNATDRGKKRKK
mmetsp:Transcript_4725/g.11118  ORF Transcript_4725/g.11118 Transcript_4725/m.11118 type:complete len:603 (+) Transcript_4725:463-2271(+)|eukprot:CAMPEP_0114515594 /NCGR_PEP_ID=MMETSP0109-20121206/16829_1 /TAXON_ID=29199 /ORGANISM="Chlorarachnion reptans, Strain CCCM449" /LENGTH=602 /DNA_ID=CAMNT_0001695829 /DNA_START=423 /DNA_END=2231 /DNA_ORIENTATION=-